MKLKVDLELKYPKQYSYLNPKDKSDELQGRGAQTRPRVPQDPEPRMPVLARPFSDLTGADPEKLQR
jgi:hypothetical protein